MSWQASVLRAINYISSERRPGGQLLLVLYRLAVIIGVVGGGVTIWYQFHYEDVMDTIVLSAFDSSERLTDAIEASSKLSRQANIAAFLAPYLRCSNHPAGSKSDEDVRQELLQKLILDGASSYRYLIDETKIKCGDNSKPEASPEDHDAIESEFFRELRIAEIRYKIGMRNEDTARLFGNAYTILPTEYSSYVDSKFATKAQNAWANGQIDEAVEDYVEAFMHLANGREYLPLIPPSLPKK